MEALTLNCPNCGAAISSDALQCQYCESKVATMACPACFAMMFIGSKHCPHCGASATEATAAQLSLLKCPRCKTDMSPVNIGAEAMRECERCGGLWVEVAAFEKICADREEQSAVLGTASSIIHQGTATAPASQVSYAPCPQCGQLMNRLNFARCSGVIVDICKGHGTWFDRDELSGIIEFVRGGGLETSRQKEKMDIEDQRRQLRTEQIAALNRSDAEALGFYHSEEDRAGGLSAARGLLKFLVE